MSSVILEIAFHSDTDIRGTYLQIEVAVTGNETPDTVLNSTNNTELDYLLIILSSCRRTFQKFMQRVCSYYRLLSMNPLLWKICTDIY